jgi:hypothetical protein
MVNPGEDGLAAVSIPGFLAFPHVITRLSQGKLPVFQ